MTDQHTSLSVGRSGELLSLADRCEKATGPDRDLDCLIAIATAWRWDGWEEGDRKIEECDIGTVMERVHNSWSSIWRHLPEYTASLDAVMTLVPAGWRLSMISSQQNGEMWAANLWVASDEAEIDSVPCGEAKTIPLALCAAALRAQATNNTISEETGNADPS